MKTVLLDTVYQSIRAGKVDEAMETVFNGLQEVRATMPHEQWAQWVRDEALSHRLRAIIHMDPFTYRSFSKPRGYAGDGVLIDMIYHHASVNLDHVPTMGKRLYEITSNAPAAKAVRNRRKLLARLVDSVAAKVHRPRILALASGHLRECELSGASQRTGKLGRYLAVDQDRKNLSVVLSEYSDWGITSMRASLGDVSNGLLKGQQFDLIYAAGLYDYLPTPFARKLTSLLFNRLAQGGVFFCANFLPGIRGSGYMESFMGWNLIYRTEIDMLELIEDIPAGQLDEATVVEESEANIVFLTITCDGGHFPFG